MTAILTKSQPLYLSEVFPLQSDPLQCDCFGTDSEISRSVGHQISWWLTASLQQSNLDFKGIMIEYYGGNFWILGRSNQSIPSVEQLQVELEKILLQRREELGDCYFLLQQLEPKITAEVISRLAVKILKITRAFPSQTIFEQNQIAVKRECQFYSTEIEIDQQTQPAIVLTSRSSIDCQFDLAQFLNNHPNCLAAEFLIDLPVKDLEKNNTAKIVKIIGTLGEHRTRLLAKATGKIIQTKLQTAPDNQPVVAVQFGKSKKSYHYPLSALHPCLSAKTACSFGVNYEIYRKKTIIGYAERLKLLSNRKEQAQKSLKPYGISLKDRCINSRHYENAIWQSAVDLNNTPLLFGNGYIGKRDKTLVGLSRGVYKRHAEFSNPAVNICAAIINFTNLPHQQFIEQISAKLKTYNFKFTYARECTQSICLTGLNHAEARKQVEDAVEKVLELDPNIVLVFLPEGDRQNDDSSGESLYCWVYSLLLQRQVASQVVYEDTLRKTSSYRYILNQVVPGILAKLGNIPFVLAEPIEIADLVVGLDISRRAKRNLPGSINACASVRLYGSNGKFQGYRLSRDTAIEGEEIPQFILNDFLPKAEIENKTVLIYRDGLFRGKEIPHLLAHGRVNCAKFILVECYKSGNPRLYGFEDRQLQQPPKGLTLKLSSHEAVLVTTSVPANIGTPNPIRLKIKPQGEQVSIDSIVDATLKLTLLHYGSLKDPRLPVPLFGADRIAYRRLQGIIPVVEGDKQYWL